MVVLYVLEQVCQKEKRNQSGDSDHTFLCEGADLKGHKHDTSFTWKSTIFACVFSAEQIGLNQITQMSALFLSHHLRSSKVYFQTLFFSSR